MARGAPRSLWYHRIAFVLIALALVFFRLLPLGDGAGGWPGPDWLLCVIFAWLIRRPDCLPLYLLVPVLLLEDFVLMRPPGLWSAIVVLGAVFVQGRAAFTRELNFPSEWLLIAAVILACFAAYRAVFFLTFLPQASFGFVFVQMMGTVLCYPLVVVVSRWVLALHKPATGEIDRYGKRL